MIGKASCKSTVLCCLAPPGMWGISNSGKCMARSAALAMPEMTHCFAGKSQEAAASYCRAIEICPDASKLWDSLAMLLTVLGRFDVADAAARQDPSALKGVLIRA